MNGRGPQEGSRKNLEAMQTENCQLITNIMLPLFRTIVRGCVCLVVCEK